MSFPQDGYENHQQHCEEFLQGLKQLKDYSIHNALKSFQLAYESVSSFHLYHNKYASYCGLLRVLSVDRNGVDLCREAVRSECNDGDVFLNLACVEWHMRSRYKSVLAVEKGLEIDKRHPGLKRMCKQIGLRKRNMVSFLNRNNPVNNMLGRLMRKKSANSKQWGLPHIF